MHTSVTYQLREKSAARAPSLPVETRATLERLATATAVILALIGIAGLASMAVFAPNALQVFGSFLERQSGRRPTKKEIERKILRTVYYLKQTGRIRIGKHGNSLRLMLGNLTTRERERLTLGNLVIRKPATWDRRYWLVAADIPTREFRNAAEAFRRDLHRLGFYPLQRTLWLHPYDPSPALHTLVSTYGIGSFVTMMHVSTLDPQDRKPAHCYWRKEGVL